MKMLLESKGIELEEVQSKLQNEREVFRSKIGGLKDEVEFKEQKVLEMHNQFVEGQEKVKVAEEQAKDLAWQNQQMRSQVLKIESELLQAKVRIESLENEIKKKGLAYRSLEDQLSSEQQHSKKYQQDLLSKQALLDTAGVHYQSEVHQLRDLLSAYRQDREKKVNHIHPMLYEDSLEQINRLTLAKEQLLRQLSYKNNQIDMFNREAQLKEQARQELERKAQAAQQLALHNEEKLVLLKESQRQLESQIQSSASLSQQGDQKH